MMSQSTQFIGQRQIIRLAEKTAAIQKCGYEASQRGHRLLLTDAMDQYDSLAPLRYYV
jgi:hypothetical protein